MTRRAWVTFAALSVIWGIPYLFIRVALRHGIPPFALTWARVTLAAVVLVALAWRAGTLRHAWRRRRWIVAYALVEISVPFPLIAVGEQHVSSSLAAILIATVPLIGALLARRFDHAERPTATRALGMAVGLAGVVALVGIDVAGSASALLSAAAIVIAAVGYAAGPMIVKHGLAGLDARATMGASLAVAAVVLAPLALAAPPRSFPGAAGIAAVVVLGLVCTAAAFVIFTVLIAEAGPSRATVITYINPVVAVALGVTLLGEQLGAGAMLGLALILAGSWLSTAGRAPWRWRRGVDAHEIAVGLGAAPRPGHD